MTVVDTRSVHPTMAQMPGTKRQPRNELKPEDFMTLLTEQLKHQNPMQPMDSSAMLQNISQLSALKSNMQMQDTLKHLEANINNSLGNTQFVTASQLVNKKVEILSNVSPLTDEGLQGSVSVPAGATNVTITVKDPTGANVVKTIELGNSKDPKSAGLMDFNWDGVKEEKEGKKVLYDPGLYQISATAVVGGKQVPLDYTMGTFKVNSVALGSDQNVVLNLQDAGGKKLQDVIKIL